MSVRDNSVLRGEIKQNLKSRRAKVIVGGWGGGGHYQCPQTAPSTKIVPSHVGTPATHENTHVPTLCTLSFVQGPMFRINLGFAEGTKWMHPGWQGPCLTGHSSFPKDSPLNSRTQHSTELRSWRVSLGRDLVSTQSTIPEISTQVFQSFPLKALLGLHGCRGNCTSWLST